MRNDYSYFQCGYILTFTFNLFTMNDIKISSSLVKLNSTHYNLTADVIIKYGEHTV